MRNDANTSAVRAAAPYASINSAGPLMTSRGISSIPVGSVGTKWRGASMCVPAA